MTDQWTVLTVCKTVINALIQGIEANKFPISLTQDTDDRLRTFALDPQP